MAQLPRLGVMYQPSSTREYSHSRHMRSRFDRRRHRVGVARETLIILDLATVGTQLARDFASTGFLMNKRSGQKPDVQPATSPPELSEPLRF